MRIASAWAWVLVVAIGCTAEPPRSPPPVESWLATLREVAQARCALEVRCAEDRDYVYSDDPACRPPELDEARWRRLFTDGETELDEQAAATCLAGLAEERTCYRSPWECACRRRS